MPTHLAAAKWPNSCRMISSMKPSEASRMCERHAATLLAASRASVSALYRSEKCRTERGRHGLERAVDHLGDPGERAARRTRKAWTATSFAAFSTHGAVPPTSAASRASRRHGKASTSGASNVSCPSSTRSRWRHGHVDALGMVKRVGDRDAHVGIAQVRERRAVVQVHDRVDDRLRMHDHVDPLVRDAEQVVRLDQLEPLVHQRRRVDRDLAAHVPGRDARAPPRA